MKAVVAAFNQEKALVGAFSVITNFRMQLFEALPLTLHSSYLGTYQPCSALLPRVLLCWCLSSQGARGALVTTRGQGYILQFGHTCNNNQASVTLNQLSFYFIQISLLFLNE